MSKKIKIAGIVLIFIVITIIIFSLSRKIGAIQGKQINPTITSFIPNPTYYPPRQGNDFRENAADPASCSPAANT